MQKKNDKTPTSEWRSAGSLRIRAVISTSNLINRSVLNVAQWMVSSAIVTNEVQTGPFAGFEWGGSFTVWVEQMGGPGALPRKNFGFKVPQPLFF